MPPTTSIETGVPLWVVAILMTAVAISAAVPKILGPVSKYISEQAEHKRRVSIEREDADLEDLQRQIAYLRREREKDQRSIQVRDRLIFLHQAWDRSAMEVLPESFPEPPGLWPLAHVVDTAAPHPPDSKAEEDQGVS